MITSPFETDTAHPLEMTATVCIQAAALFTLSWGFNAIEYNGLYF